MRVNRWTHSESQMYLQKALSVWNERSLVGGSRTFLHLENWRQGGAKHQEWEGGHDSSEKFLSFSLSFQGVRREVAKGIFLKMSEK